MRYILFLLTISFLFSCETNPERKDTPQGNRDRINSLFTADSLGPEYTTMKGINTERIVIVDENKDTIIVSFNPQDVTIYNPDTAVRRYNKGSVVTNPPPVEPPPTNPGSYGTLVHSSGFDKASDVNKNQGPLNSVSTTVYKTGPGSFRTEAGPGTNVSSGYRSEMQYDGSQLNPSEGVWEYDVYYEGWKSFSGGGHSVQWHPNSGTGSAVLSLQNYGGRFNVVRTLNDSKGNIHQSGTLKDTKPNTWYTFRWEIKWSTGSDGYIRFYIDNELYYTFTGRTADNTGTPYFKLGQNRWNLGTSPLKENTVVYYDNLKIYSKK